MKWENTGTVGEHGDIYRNPETGELAEEHGGSYLVEREPPLLHGGSCFLLEQEYGHDNQGW